ncbi:MAG: TetR/AcrR family transcriptional regulator [Planctomycetes bacterium]|nr:TetR/AcrR family transcriptional regulator [Planctomycetota bacterium]
MPSTDTKTAILDAAQGLIQIRGYHAFSYRDLAELVGIKPASIHYYFARKSDLAEALVARYRVEFAGALAGLRNDSQDAMALLASYAGLYSKTFENEGRWCLCASLAADVETLEDDLRLAVRGFFEDQEQWLERVIEEGARAGQLCLRGPAGVAARGILSALEGALITARAHGNVKPLKEVSTWLIGTFEP